MLFSSRPFKRVPLGRSYGGAVWAVLEGLVSVWVRIGGSIPDDAYLRGPP